MTLQIYFPINFNTLFFSQMVSLLLYLHGLVCMWKICTLPKGARLNPKSDGDIHIINVFSKNSSRDLNQCLFKGRPREKPSFCLIVGLKLVTVKQLRIRKRFTSKPWRYATSLKKGFYSRTLDYTHTQIYLELNKKEFLLLLALGFIFVTVFFGQTIMQELIGSLTPNR